MTGGCHGRLLYTLGVGFFREAREVAIAVCFTLLNVHNFQKYDRTLVSDSFTEKLKLGFYRNFVYNNNINIINLRNEDDNFSIDRRIALMEKFSGQFFL